MKRAELHNFWIPFIFAVIVIVAFLGILYMFRIGTVSYLTAETCKESIDANARGHLRGITIDSDIKCPTKVFAIASQDNEKKEKIIANEMNDCWTKFNAGKSELFSGNKIYCSICSVMDFEDKKNVDNFQNYLVNTNAPNKDISYADYFSGFQTSKSQEAMQKLTPAQLSQLQATSIDGKKSYAVIFLYARGKDEMQKVVRHLTGQTAEGQNGRIGFGVGLVAGAGAGAGIAIFALGSNPIGWAIGGAFVVGSAVDAAFYFLSNDNKPQWASFIVLTEYNAQSLKELNCQELK